MILECADNQGVEYNPVIYKHKGLTAGELDEIIALVKDQLNLPPSERQIILTIGVAQ